MGAVCVNWGLREGVKRSRDRKDRLMSRQSSAAAMTGETEASASDVRLAKCHSDHLEAKDTHTHTESGWAEVERARRGQVFTLARLKRGNLG